MGRARRSPLLSICVLVAAAGSAGGLAAAAKVGPFESPASPGRSVAARTSQPLLPAGQLYPAPTSLPAVHQLVQVTDPAPPRQLPPARPAPAAATSVAAIPSEPPSRTPRPSPAPSPSPSPCGGDCGNGGDN